MVNIPVDLQISALSFCKYTLIGFVADMLHIPSYNALYVHNQFINIENLNNFAIISHGRSHLGISSIWNNARGIAEKYRSRD